MSKSIASKLSKLRYDGHITDEEYDRLKHAVDIDEAMIAKSARNQGIADLANQIRSLTSDRPVMITIADGSIYDVISMATDLIYARDSKNFGGFEYGGHYFKPHGKFDPDKYKSLYNINLRSHTELKLWDDYFANTYKEKPIMVYNYNAFYTAMQNADDDIFFCDNGKLYIPCQHELMEFLGYR